MKKVLLASVLVSAIAGLGVTAAPTLLAQAASGQSDISIQNPAEFNAYQNVISATDPKTKASAAESFLTTYPQSVVKKTITEALMDAYSAFDQAKTVDAAKKMLQLDPNNLKAMYLIVYIDKQLASQAAAANPAQQATLLDEAATTATTGLKATKPDGVKDDVFKTQKDTADILFHSAIANDSLYSKKDLKQAIADFRTELQAVAPEASKVPPALNDTLLLGQTYTQLTPPDMINGVWFLTRAENFAPASFKPVIDKQAKYWYKRYHGKEDGYDAVLTASAATVFPPDGWTIAPAPTSKDIADKFVADNPDFASYAVGDSEYVLSNASPANAEKVFASLKDKTILIPGTVIAATASQIQLAATEDAKTDKKADFTINMKTPLADKDIPAVGSDLTNLVGTFDSYTQTPAQIIMRDGEIQVEKKKPVAKKPSAARKKPAGM